MKPIPLDDIVEQMDMQTGDMKSFLDLGTGEFIYVEVSIAGEVPVEFESDRYIMVPDKYDIDEYNIMKRFCYTVEDDLVMDELLDALRGRGAFGRFKDKIWNLRIDKDWYEYQHNALRKIAAEWCRRFDVGYTEK